MDVSHIYYNPHGHARAVLHHRIYGVVSISHAKYQSKEFLALWSSRASADMFSMLLPDFGAEESGGTF